MAKLFGFSIEDADTLPKDAVSPVPPNDADGVEHYMSSGFFGSYVDIEGVYSCLLYTSPSPRDRTRSRMPSSA